MPDIIIKGMEMPKNCIDCMFTTIDYDMCILAKNDLMLCGGRPSWCPLIPLTAGHGRLGDLDKLEDAFIRYYLGQERSNHLIFTPVEIKQHFADMIADFPTIIEADLEWRMKNCCCFGNTDPGQGGNADG